MHLAMLSRDALQREVEASHKRIAELEAAVLAAKELLRPTTDQTEPAWQVLDQAYHQHKPTA